VANATPRPNGPYESDQWRILSDVQEIVFKKEDINIGEAQRDSNMFLLEKRCGTG
jgi:hypothetical protein